jgi:hypothetical protein
MAGVLTLAQWLGGPDEVIVESIFPSTQKTYAYNFAQSVTGWTFHLDYQTVVVDAIAYTRDGEPNFADSKVIGSFASGVVSTATYISVVSTGSGLVNVTHPGQIYTGPVLPDARQNVPLLVMSFTWTDGQTPAQKNTHRMGKILAWEPGVTVGDPTLATGYTATTLASVV